MIRGTYQYKDFFKFNVSTCTWERGLGVKNTGDNIQVFINDGTNDIVLSDTHTSGTWITEDTTIIIEDDRADRSQAKALTFLFKITPAAGSECATCDPIEREKTIYV